MGRTPKPLTILCHPDIAAWEEVQVLAQQGHQIVVPFDLKIANVPFESLDLILGPHCWRMDTPHRKYLSLAITAGRRYRYPKEK